MWLWKIVWCHWKENWDRWETRKELKAAAERTKVPKPQNLKLNVSQHSSSHHWGSDSDNIYILKSLNVASQFQALVPKGAPSFPSPDEPHESKTTNKPSGRGRSAWRHTQTASAKTLPGSVCATATEKLAFPRSEASAVNTTVCNHGFWKKQLRSDKVDYSGSAGEMESDPGRAPGCKDYCCPVLCH